MNNIIPFFELNGQRYEIKRTHYLIAEYEKLTKESELSNEDKQNAVKLQSLIGDVKKYAEMVKELEEKFFDTFDSEDERRYLKAKELYEKSLNELAKLEIETGSGARLQKISVDILEKVAIKALAEQYFNFDEVKAKAIWEQYAENLGNNATVDWLNAMGECLFEEKEDKEKDNSFLSQMRKRAEQQAINRKNGIRKK